MGQALRPCLLCKRSRQPECGGAVAFWSMLRPRWVTIELSDVHHGCRYRPRIMFALVVGSSLPLLPMRLLYDVEYAILQYAFLAGRATCWEKRSVIVRGCRLAQTASSARSSRSRQQPATALMNQTQHKATQPPFPSREPSLLY